MKFAFVDPPYHGMGKSMYGPMHDQAAKWDDKQSHIDLLASVVTDYPDGWVLSCNPRDLSWLLPNCPDDVRVGAWTKTFHQIRKTTTQYAWEPVVFRGGRVLHGRNPLVRDWLSCARNMKNGIRGSKPHLFNLWVLDILAAQPGDELVDLFPGSRGMEQACIERGVTYLVGPENI
jgi:hypothetical protein